MKRKLFPDGSFCIELTDEQGNKMFDLLDKKKKNEILKIREEIKELEKLIE